MIAQLFTSIKAHSLSLLAWTAVFIAPIQAAILAIGALIAVDFATGIWCSIRAKRPVTSAGMRSTATKMAAYSVAIVSSHLMQLYFIHNVVPLVQIIAGYLAATEFKSILENVHILTGVNLWTQVKDVFARPADKVGRAQTEQVAPEKKDEAA